MSGADAVLSDLQRARATVPHGSYQNNPCAGMGLREKITVLAQSRAVLPVSRLKALSRVDNTVFELQGSDEGVVVESVCKSSSNTFPGDRSQRSLALGRASTPVLNVHVVASREALDTKPRSPEKFVGVADVKCWSSMRKWQRCTFLHSMWSSLSLLRKKHLLQGSTLTGTETRTLPQGMGCFSTWFQGLPSRFL